MSDKVTLVSLLGSHDNFHEPIPLANKQSTILGVVIFCQVLSWICGILRMWTRFRIVKSPGWDDLFIALSLIVTAFGAIVICLGATKYGLGQHFLKLGSTSAMSNYLKIFYMGNGSYVLSTTLIKLALLFQYLRVLEPGTNLRRLTTGVTVFVALWGFAFAIIVWFPCSPISGYWSLDPNAKCWGFASQDVNVFIATFEAHTAFNLILDLILLTIPIQIFFMSNVQKKMRWGLLGILFLGGVANGASIWRLVTIIEHHAATSPTFDPSWYAPVSILATVVEVDIAVVCACVPVFWPALKATGFQIFITKEVKITSETRSAYPYDNDEGIQLQHAGVMPAGARYVNRKESHNELRNARSGHSNGSSSPRSYDKYELAHVEFPYTPARTQPGTHVSVSAKPPTTNQWGV